MSNDEQRQSIELLRSLAAAMAPRQDNRITVNGGTTSLIVGLICLASLMYAVSSVREANNKTNSVTRIAASKAWATAKVHAAEMKAAEEIRQRDMQELAQLRGRVLNLEAHKDSLLRRVGQLEASNAN